MPTFFVQHDAEWRVEWSQTESGEVIAQVLEARLMIHRGIWIRSTGVGLSRIFTELAVYLINLLSSGVVGLQLVISDGQAGEMPP
jgi:hypothetical protein